MRFGSTAKVLLKCKLKYYRISECGNVSCLLPKHTPDTPLFDCAADLDSLSACTSLQSLHLAGCVGINTNQLAHLSGYGQAPLIDNLRDLDVSNLFITFPRGFDKAMQPFHGLTRLIMKNNKYAADSQADDICLMQMPGSFIDCLPHSA